MTRARDIANLVDANGDIVAGALDNVPASNDASALTTGTLDGARLPSTLPVGDSHTIGNDADDNLQITSSTAENIIINSAGGTVAFKENGTEVARLTGGSLGMGVTNPATPIEISSASNTALRLTNTATNYWEISNDSNLKFNRGGTEYMRFDGSGNIYAKAEGGSGTNIDVRQGSAKVWSNIDGGANSVRDSYNLSSMTDLGSGQPQANFSNNMSNSNYTVPFNTGGHNGVNRMDSVRGLENGSFTTSKCSFYTGANSNYYYYDSSNVHSAVFGDLA